MRAVRATLSILLMIMTKAAVPLTATRVQVYRTRSLFSSSKPAAAKAVGVACHIATSP